MITARSAQLDGMLKKMGISEEVLKKMMSDGVFRSFSFKTPAPGSTPTPAMPLPPQLVKISLIFFNLKEIIQIIK